MLFTSPERTFFFFLFDYRINSKGRDPENDGESFSSTGFGRSKITFKLVNHYLSLRTTRYASERVSITRLEREKIFLPIFILIPRLRGHGIMMDRIGEPISCEKNYSKSRDGPRYIAKYAWH